MVPDGIAIYICTYSITEAGYFASLSCDTVVLHI